MHLPVQQTGGIVPGPFGMPKTVRVGIAASIEALDPRAGAGGPTALVLGQIFEPADALLQPLRAEDEDGAHFSAAVCPGVRFSDGTLLTAEIAARSLRGAPALAGRATIDVHDDRLWFHLAAPNPRFALTLARGACAIVLETGRQLHGTGPFLFDQHPNLRLLQLSPSIRLVRNPYYRSTTAIQEVRFTVFPPDADGVPRKLLHALRQESIDLTTAAAPVATHPGELATLVQPGNSTALLFFNTTRRPTSSIDVRRGIAAALDRRELASVCYGRGAEPFAATSVLPPSMNGAAPHPASDRDTVRAEVGARLTLLVPSSSRPFLPNPSAVASAIQSQLAHAGVSVTVLEARNDDEYHAALHNRTFDLALGGIIAETPDPADLLESLRTTWGPEDQIPWTPLVHGHTTVVYARHLHNVTVTPDGFLPLSTLKF